MRTAGAKVIYGGACTALLVASLLFPTLLAFAEETIVINQDSASKTAEVIVGYSQAEEYRLNIPAKVDLSNGAQSASITASSMNIAPTRQLKVSISGGVADDGKVELVETTNPSLATYTMLSLSQSGAGVPPQTVVATFTGTSIMPTSGGTLYFSALPEDAQAGTYTGVITFSLAISDQ